MHNFDRTFLLSNTLFCCLFLLLRLFSLERALFPIFFTQLLFFYYAGKKKHCRSTKPNNTSPYSQCHNLAQDRPVAPSPIRHLAPITAGQPSSQHPGPKAPPNLPIPHAHCIAIQPLLPPSKPNSES